MAGCVSQVVEVVEALIVRAPPLPERPVILGVNRVATMAFSWVRVVAQMVVTVILMLIVLMERQARVVGRRHSEALISVAVEVALGITMLKPFSVELEVVIH